MIGKYKVITLCGSTRFKNEFLKAQKRLTLETSNIVVSVGLFGHSGDDEVWTEGTKEMLDDMHLRKIDMADEIYVLNVDGYIGSSTKKEIAYAKRTGKAVRYLEIHGIKQFEDQITDPKNSALDQIEKVLDQYGFSGEIRFDRKGEPYVNLGDVRRKRLRAQFWYNDGRINFFAGKEMGYWFTYSFNSPYKVPWENLSDLECKLTFPDVLTAIQFIQEIALLRGNH